MSESEYTITIHVRNPGRQYDPAFNMTLQCRHCCAAWFKRVEGDYRGIPVECVNCGQVMLIEQLFNALDQKEINFGD